jgi:hypothetical protein
MFDDKYVSVMGGSTLTQMHSQTVYITTSKPDIYDYM